MPTPFTHLEIAQRLLSDKTIPPSIRNLLNTEPGAFLLGNIAADARVKTGTPRDITHFYRYRVGISEHPWLIMLKQHPSLTTPRSPAHRVFIAGYIAHLSVDEIWSLHMVGPHFAQREWADIEFRFYMLHIILIHMDTHDLQKLEQWQASALHDAHPDHWLPFIDDDNLRLWQNFIYQQIEPGGKNQTLQVLGQRIGKKPQELRTFLDSPQQMQNGLWNNVKPDILKSVEQLMYQHALKQMMLYMNNI